MKDASSHVKLRKIGASGVNAVSKAQKDNLVVKEGDTVHIVCRKNYLKKRKRSSTASDDDTPCATRSKNTFDFRSKYFFMRYRSYS